MALSRDNPRNLASNPRPGVIKDGFFWGSYPALEKVLRQSMDEYYELSTAKRQSKEQQLFNNRLVSNIRVIASQNGWVFDPASFDDKKIRDRIRCFFKTHIQNAKKRLKTVIKNQHKKTNKLLVAGAREAIRCVLEGVEYSHTGLLPPTAGPIEETSAGAVKKPKQKAATPLTVSSKRLKKEPAADGTTQEYVYSPGGQAYVDDGDEDEDEVALGDTAAAVMSLGFNLAQGTTMSQELYSGGR